MSVQVTITVTLALSLVSLSLGAISVRPQSDHILGDKRPGESCYDDNDCLGAPEKSICRYSWGFGFCECTANHIIVNQPDDSRCEPIRQNLWEECVSPLQCKRGRLGTYADCVNIDAERRGCGCEDSATFEPGPGPHTCYPKANQTGSICAINQQCKANLGEFSKCENNRCECEDEENLSIPRADGTKCLEIRGYLGQECELQEQCTRGTPGELSVCDETLKICRCQEGATSKPDLRVCKKGDDGECCACPMSLTK